MATIVSKHFFRLKINYNINKIIISYNNDTRQLHVLYNIIENILGEMQFFLIPIDFYGDMIFSGRPIARFD